MEVPPALARHRREVEDFLRNLLDRPGAPLLYQMARYHLGWEDEQGNPSAATGKGVRAGICLMACEAAGGTWETAVPAASAVELVHSFSLVHDDIQDRDRERHHRPAVWTVWGEAQAINAGDALLALARLALTQLSERGVSANSVLSAGRILDRATLEMVEGQTLDLQFEERADVSVEAYMDMVAHKTGALFGCSLALGAIAAAASAECVKRFEKLGRQLGLGFQIADDLLGTWGDERKTGKPAGADIRRRKKSLPLVIALNGVSGNEIRRAYADAEPDVLSVIRAMDGARVQDACREMARDVVAEARGIIDAMGMEDQARHDLAGVAEFLLEREF